MFYYEFIKAFKNDQKFIFVDDGSQNGTFKELKNCFYKLIFKISDSVLVKECQIKRNVRDVIVSIGQYNCFTKGIFSFVGLILILCHIWLSQGLIVLVNGI